MTRREAMLRDARRGLAFLLQTNQLQLHHIRVPARATSVAHSGADAHAAAKHVGRKRQETGARGDGDRRNALIRNSNESDAPGRRIKAV